MFNRKSHAVTRRRIGLAAGSILTLSHSALSQTLTYNSTTATSWSIGSAWLGGVPANGVGSTAFVTPDLPTAKLDVALNQDVTLSRLILGDSTVTGTTYQLMSIYQFATFKFTFDNGASNFSLEHATGNNSTDSISANIQLNSTLATGTVASDGLDLGAIRMTGIISGPGGVLRTSNAANVNATGSLSFENPLNSYTGATVLEAGKLKITNSVLFNQDSVLGHATSAVVLGTANTPAGVGTFDIQLEVGPTSSTAALTFDRDIAFNATSANRTNVFLAPVVDATADTSSLTVTGNISFATSGNSRNYSISVGRAGQLLDLRGILSGGVSAQTAAAITWNGQYAPAFTAVGSDGRIGGTIRLASVSSSYASNQLLQNGTLLIDGTVGALGTDSPLGRTTVGLSDGASSTGNLALNNGRDSVRAIVMQSGGTSFARDLSPGGGNSATASAANAVASAQAAYGTASAINLTNGFVFGGRNTSGTVLWTGAISPQNVNLGSGTINSAAAITPVVAGNIALLAATGGTVDFSGSISDTAQATTVARITINQFRNHPLLDEGTSASGTGFFGDGTPDPATANQLVGTATGGTVVLSRGSGNSYAGGTEVLGGTLLVRSTGTNSATGTGPVLIAAPAALGGAGYIGGAVTDNGTLAPGDGIGTLTAGAFTLSSTANLVSQVGPGATLGAATANGDLATTAGAFNMGGAKLTIVPLNFVPDIQANNNPYLYRYTLVNAAGGVTGTVFANLVALGGNAYQYNDGLVQGTVNINPTNITFDLTSVPEPSTIGLLALGGLALKRRRLANV